MSGQKQASTKFQPGRIKPQRKALRGSSSVRYDGENPEFALVNPDPDVKYFWARQGTRGTGSQGYREGVLGYQVILASDDPGDVHPRVCINQQPGSPFIKQDLILMGIHREDYEILVDEGTDGRGGRVAAERVNQALGRGTSPSDDTSGIDPRQIRLEGYQSSELVREQGRG